MPRRTMIDVARAIKAEADRQGRAAGSPLKGGRIKLRARDQITGSGSAVRCRIKGMPTGPWVWVTDGTKPHEIAPRKKRKRGRNSRKGGYLWAEGANRPIRKAVHHPGTSGKGAWKRVRAFAEREAPRMWEEAVVRAVRG